MLCEFGLIEPRRHPVGLDSLGPQLSHIRRADDQARNRNRLRVEPLLRRCKRPIHIRAQTDRWRRWPARRAGHNLHGRISDDALHLCVERPNPPLGASSTSRTLRTKTSGPNGFCKISADGFRPLCPLITSSEWPDINTTLISGRLLRSSSASLNPFMTGITVSVTTRSMLLNADPHWPMASAPLPASQTRYPATLRASRNIRRSELSSSTNRMVSTPEYVCRISSRFDSTNSGRSCLGRYIEKVVPLPSSLVKKIRPLFYSTLP